MFLCSLACLGLLFQKQPRETQGDQGRALRENAALAARWQAGNAELGLATSCTVDHSVRSVVPVRLQAHLAERAASGITHHAAPRADESRSFWILDLPLPVQVDGRRHCCHTCAHLRIFDNFTVETHDVVAAYPDLRVHYVKKQAPVLLTRRFLLHVVQLFYDRLNSRATRRALVEQICGNALSLNVAGRMKEFCSAVPKSVSIRPILMAALEDYTKAGSREMQRLVNVHSGSVIRGDGNHDVAKRITMYDEAGRRGHRGKSENVSYIFEVACAQKCKLQLAHAPLISSRDDRIIDEFAVEMTIFDLGHALHIWRRQMCLWFAFYRSKQVQALVGPKAVPDVKTPGLADLDAKMKLQRVILSNPRCAGPTSTAHIGSVLKYHFQKEKEEKPAKYVLAAVKDLLKVGILQEVDKKEVEEQAPKLKDKKSAKSKEATLKSEPRGPPGGHAVLYYQTCAWEDH